MRFSNSIALAALSLGATAASSDQTYDYIIVGGGPSGLITAERLSETGKTVLVIEGGEGPTVDTGAEADLALSWDKKLTAVDVPALGSAQSSLSGKTYRCSDTASRAACVLGGGPEINPMMFVRPAAHDFDDHWPEGWKWKDIAPAAERLYSRNPGTTTPSADGIRYDLGLWRVLSSFFDTIGWTQVDMLSQPDEKHAVYSHPSWNIHNGLRGGPLRTYFPLALDRDNFHYRINTRVTRVVRSQRQPGRVLAVETKDQLTGETETIRLTSCTGRVILAAGSMSTPRLLFGAGVGPAAQIEAAQQSGVKVPPQKDWIDLPVGQHLRDHAMFTFDIDTSAWNGSQYSYETVPSDANAVYNGTATDLIELFEKASPNGHDGQLAGSRHRAVFFHSRSNTLDGITRYFQGSCAPSGKDVFNINWYLTHGATSEGLLQLNGTTGDTYYAESPYFHTDADVEAVTSFITEFVGNLTGPAGRGFTVAKSVDQIIATLQSAHHVIGTARVGTDDGRKANGSAVVDTNAKVYGLDNLFVVDASMHRDLPTGNTQAYVMVVAEAAVAKIIALE